MRIILLQDVENVGDKNEVKNVSGGYARNYLIPRNLARPATESNLKQLDHKLKFVKRREEAVERKLVQMTGKVQGSSVEIKAHAGVDGKLYGSVTNKHIALALTEKLGIEVDKKRVKLETPIKQTGEFQVVVDMSQGKRAEVTIKIVPDEKSLEDAAEAKKQERETIAAAAPEAATEGPKTEAPEEKTAPAEAKAEEG